MSRFGGSWVRPTTRLAIYLRDGLGCVYCCKDWSETGSGLTLDHIVPRARGGSGDPTNLVTCCRTCNEKKGTLFEGPNTPQVIWEQMGAERNLTGPALLRLLDVHRNTPLGVHRDRARYLVKARPEWYEALMRASKFRPADAPLAEPEEEPPF